MPVLRGSGLMHLLLTALGPCPAKPEPQITGAPLRSQLPRPQIPAGSIQQRRIDRRIQMQARQSLLDSWHTSGNNQLLRTGSAPLCPGPGPERDMPALHLLSHLRRIIEANDAMRIIDEQIK